MKKIAIVGQYPMPIHGLSKAIDTLYNSRLNKEYEFEKIDIKDNKKFFSNVMKIIKSKSDIFYYTISQSIGGNLRDLIFLSVVAIKRKKSIIHLHGGYYRKMFDEKLGPQSQFFNKLIFGKARYAIVLGDSLKYIFKGIIHEDGIKIVKNCVENNSLLADDVLDKKTSNMLNKRHINILYLSNFIQSKGYKKVLELAKRSLPINKNINFLFAGKFFDKREEEYFNKYVGKNNLTNIKFIGEVSGIEKINAFKNSDIFVLPTTYEKEGQPIAIIEAMGNGLAIITTNHAGIPDLVEDSLNGFLISHDDANSMLNRINELYEDREKLKEIAQRNIKKIKASFLEEHYISSLDQIFKEV